MGGGGGRWLGGWGLELVIFTKSPNLKKEKKLFGGGGGGGSDFVLQSIQI